MIWKHPNIQGASTAMDDSGFEIEEVVAENDDGPVSTSLANSEQDCPS